MELKSKTGRIRAITAIIILAAIISTITNAVITNAKNAKETIMDNDILRLHIIANSDSDEDQKLKFKVRNRVLAKVQNALEGSSSASRTRAYIEENLEEIEACALQCIRAEGYDYNVKARIGVTAIPAKQYDDVYFPAGSYEALTITIGEGKGQNWWCVVFPPLCLVDAREGGYEEMFDEDLQGRLVLKSKVLELLRQGVKQRE